MLAIKLLFCIERISLKPILWLISLIPYITTIVKQKYLEIERNSQGDGEKYFWFNLDIRTILKQKESMWLGESLIFFLQSLLWLPLILRFLPAFFKFNSFAEINLYLECVLTIKYNKWLLLDVLLMSHKKFSLLSLLHSWLHSHCINEHLKTNQCHFLLICSSFQITVITTRKHICGWKVKIKKWWISKNCISIAPFSEIILEMVQ